MAGIVATFTVGTPAEDAPERQPATIRVAELVHGRDPERDPGPLTGKRR